MTKHIYCDVVIAGCGAAGLYTALNLPKDLHVLMICKEDMDTCDSMLAQGASACSGARTTMSHTLRTP